MKKASIILVIAIIINIFSSIGVLGATVYEEISDLYVTKGIEGKHIKKLTSSGWYNINYLTVDLNEEGIGLKILSDQDPKVKETLLTFAKNEKNVVAAINADFFTTYTTTASSEGMMIKDGNLITTPSNDPNYTTFTLSKDLIASIGNFTFDIMVTSKRTNDSSKILFYNKNANPMYLKIFDKNFGSITPGSMNDGYEVVVEDGVVTNVLSNKEGVEIPENGYVLHNSLRHSLFLSQNFYIGDEVELSFSVSPDIENIKEAVGGGTPLLKDGEIVPFTLSDSTQPMTALGIDKDGKKITLFTIDGRQTHSRGMNFTEIASFLKDLGCYSAMSFDGGGSTTMVASANGNELKNINMQTSYRKIINGIGITAKREKGDFKGMTISLSDTEVFPKQDVEIRIDSAYDEYGSPYEIDIKKVKFSSDKKGSFKGNVFTPEESGKHIITASYKDASIKKELVVYTPPTKLISSVSSFDITDKIQEVTFYLADDEGYTNHISSDELTFEFDEVFGYIEKDKLTLTKLVEGKIKASYDDITLIIPVTNNKEEVELTFLDKFLRTTDEEGFVFATFGINNHGDTLFSNYITGKRNIMANTYDLSAFKVVPETVTSKTIRVSNYGKEEYDHSLFIKLDNSKGSITSTKPEQWDWLLSLLEKGVTQKNVFINMPYDIKNYKDKDELKILTDVLKENLKGKNIFIVTYGEDCTYKVVDGIRYINVSEIPEFSYEDPEGTFEKLKYAKFTIINEEVYFEFASII